ncbi:MAG: hypothetical protein U9N52_09505 [Campylobacterota bacterium]|nr:hypothetical protein [Campylobacterota bacterium]
MDKEQQKRKLLKLAKEAFERACILRDTQRIEVYLLEGRPEISDVLEEDEEIIYGENRVLCYQIYGHDHLEPEIKTWIDIARIIEQPSEGMPLPEPTEIELSIRDLAGELALARGVASEEISSNEVFANLPFDLLEQIENAIIEFWWQGAEDENAKILAKEQIEAAV